MTAEYTLSNSTEPIQAETEQLFFDATTYFDKLLLDISNAKHEIILETYIFALDCVGQSILHALQQAIQRNVCVKLLIDGVGSSKDADIIATSLQHPNAQVRIYHPLPWSFSSYRWAINHEPTLIKLWRFIVSINNRDHRKLCLIDKQVAWLGSFNITQGEVHGRSISRHETAARLTGLTVAVLRQDFFHVWHQKEKVFYRNWGRFLSNHSLNHRKQKNKLLVDYIKTAKSRIWITNAYFCPSRALIAALKTAVNNQVDVQIIVPLHSDIFFFPALTRTFYADLLAANLRIYEYHHNILHSKTILIDNELIIGSTNLNYRSYFHDLELDAILSEPNTITLMENKFINDKKHCHEITLLKMNRFPKIVIWLGWVSRLLRYWF